MLGRLNQSLLCIQPHNLLLQMLLVRHLLECYKFICFLCLVVAGSDYTTVNGQVVFAIGEFTKTVTVPITSDAISENDEVFNVDLATDCCADVTTGQVVVTITESADGK